MSRKIRRRPTSAAASCNRIEIVPSRRVAVAWACWWLLVLAVVFAASAPWILRLILILLLPFSLPSMFRFVLLRGRKAIRAVAWSGQGDFHLELGPGHRPLMAGLAVHQKLGLGLWTLEFRTGEGRFRLLVDTGLQRQSGVRRLARALERGDLLPSRPKV